MSRISANPYSRKKVLFADDDPDLLEAMHFHVSEWNYEVHTAQSADQLRKTLARDHMDLILLDLNFGEENGFDVLNDLQNGLSPSPVIVLTADSSVPTVVTAMRSGAYDFISKPIDLPNLRSALNKAFSQAKYRSQATSTTSKESGGETPMLGNHPAMQNLRAIIREAAPTNATVLILGESGTGKELIARELHRQSDRRSGPFIPVNMAALPASLAEGLLFGHEKGAFTGADAQREGWCEMADSGTLFLDEIGELDILLQAKLLRFLQEREIQRVGSTHTQSVDVRVIAATNRDPEEMIRTGKLRDDLYYRLNVIPIAAPPLRVRRDDIALLSTYFLKRAVEQHNKVGTRLSARALEAIQQYDWPGNIRQLENLIDRMVILNPCGEITFEMLPAELQAIGTAPLEPIHSSLPAPPSGEGEPLRLVDRLEKQAILEALEHCQGNVVQAGRSLQMGQATIYRKVKRYGIELRRPRK